MFDPHVRHILCLALEKFGIKAGDIRIISEYTTIAQRILPKTPQNDDLSQWASPHFPPQTSTRLTAQQEINQSVIVRIPIGSDFWIKPYRYRLVFSMLVPRMRVEYHSNLGKIFQRKNIFLLLLRYVSPFNHINDFRYAPISQHLGHSRVVCWH